jgi:hypothetical protein
MRKNKNIRSIYVGIKYPHYCPDLTLNEFWLIPEIKSVLDGRFLDVEDIKKT